MLKRFASIVKHSVTPLSALGAAWLEVSGGLTVSVLCTDRSNPFAVIASALRVTGWRHLAEADVTSKCLASCFGRRVRTCEGLPSCWTKCSLVSFPLCPAALPTFHALTHPPTHLGSTSVLMKANWQPGKLASSQFSVGSLCGGCEEVIFHVRGEERLEVVTSKLPSQKHYDGAR